MPADDEEERAIARRDAKDIIRLAVGAAGASDDEAAWRGRVDDNIRVIAAMLDPRSDQMTQATRMLESVKFTGTFVKAKLETSSTRIVVTTSNVNGEMEEIRTDRTDRPLGQQMARRVETLQPGDHLLIWKYMEEMDGSSGRKVRVMPHFTKLESSPATGSLPAPGAVATPAAPEVAPTPPVAAGEYAVAARMEKLTNDQKVRFVRECRNMGINNFMTPEGKDLERVHKLLGDYLSDDGF